jgi:transcriptional regulator
MYTPQAFAVAPHVEILGTLRRISFGHLVSTDVTGQHPLESTALPFVVDDGLSELRGHFARANQHWKHIDGLHALMIVAGPDAYISPRWYPSKVEHGRVVPTWNYEVIHVHGTVEIHDDPSWKQTLVTDLTDHNELRVGDPELSDAWAVSDAPKEFIDSQLNAIVGVRLKITAIEAKRKLSQNKAAADRTGALEGLGRSARLNDIDTAALMRSSDQR